MALIDILRRKDAAAIIVAIVLGFILWGVISSVGGNLTLLITGKGKGLEFMDFFRPIVAMLVELVLAEIAVRAGIATRETIKNAK